MTQDRQWIVKWQEVIDFMKTQPLQSLQASHRGAPDALLD